jgi:hypothetical protein
MVRQILPNNNENAIGIFSKKFWDLNKAYVAPAVMLRIPLDLLGP